MTPFLFGPPDRRLFGAHHPADARHPQIDGVVLCSPFGEEASRAHRFFYVLAEQLSRAGIHVLRFDGFGTGDSAGDDEEGDLHGWCADLRAAHDELRRRAPAARIAWAGARLGATVAILAAGQAPPAGLRRLVAWDPVVDGRGFLHELRTQRVAALEIAYSLPDPSRCRALADDPTFLEEQVGHCVSPRLRVQLDAVHADSLGLPGSIDTRVIADATDSPLLQWVAAQQAAGGQARLVAHAPARAWSPKTRPDQTSVPRQTLQHILQVIADA